jgi:hypothetical protein
MWINGGKRYQFMMGRDFQTRARFVITLHFGWRGNVPIGKTPWRHHWGFSTRHIEERIKRLRRLWQRWSVLDYIYWPCVRWKWRTLMRLRERKCNRLGGHIYKPTPEQLPYHIGRCIRCQKSQPW